MASACGSVCGASPCPSASAVKMRRFRPQGPENEKRLDEHRAFVDAAAGAGVEHVVYVSFFGAAPDATFTLARDHFATEPRLIHRLRRAGTPQGVGGAGRRVEREKDAFAGDRIDQPRRVADQRPPRTADLRQRGRALP